MFNIQNFLSTSGTGRKLMELKAGDSFYNQGETADTIFYLRTGRGKVTIVSERGKEATVTLLVGGDFFGEECMVSGKQRRNTTATAVIDCLAIKLNRKSMFDTLHQNAAFADFFMQFTLARGIRTQEDLVDQLFNSSERRLARALLLMADFDKTGTAEELREVPHITQETIADMVGTTRSRVSFFMNRFRSLGYIDYNHGHLKIHKMLLTRVLKDTLSNDDNAKRPALLYRTPK
jgi:CRP/FNR family cyclic AMP-dependent transcriptional regulator